MKPKSLKLSKKFFLICISTGFIFSQFVSKSYGLEIQNLYEANLYEANLIDQKIDVSVSLDLLSEINPDFNININTEDLEKNGFSHFLPSYYSNQAYIYQIGTLNTAYQYQTGTLNLALIYQEGRSNIATQIQQGTQNKAISLQIGENNLSFQQQCSSGNLAIAYQIGIGNYIEQHQGLRGGSNHQSIVIQQGNFNRAFVYQY